MMQMRVAEMNRELMTGARVFIADLRRDMIACIHRLFWLNSKVKKIRPGFISSNRALHIRHELLDLIINSPLNKCDRSINFTGVRIAGVFDS
jgi:hypothetical protein